MLNEIREIVAETKSHLQPLSTKNTYSYSTALYFKHYGLDLVDNKTEHLFGTFQSNGFALAGHIFKPINYKATVFILHGYLSHCGLLSKLIKYLVEAGFAVAVFDLPGHGLSGGKPTEIEDFSDYTDSLSDFMNTVRPILHGPYHLIGHSSGAAVIMDYLFAGRSDCFDKIVLTAPLVRSDLWFLSMLKYRDPLQATKVSVKWIDAFFRWNDKIASAESIARPIMIIQGTRENIVAWKYNLKFIQSKFGKAEIKLIENGRHELLNESADICKEVFSQIGSYLES